jgi:hypothetical protein
MVAFPSGNSLQPSIGRGSQGFATSLDAHGEPDRRASFDEEPRGFPVSRARHVPQRLLVESEHLEEDCLCFGLLHTLELELDLNHVCSPFMPREVSAIPQNAVEQPQPGILHHARE